MSNLSFGVGTAIIAVASWYGSGCWPGCLSGNLSRLVRRGPEILCSGYIGFIPRSEGMPQSWGFGGAARLDTDWYWGLGESPAWGDG